ncbi:MAG: LPXTG cell wall anchor domain-containing protein, partial [Oscillospiraceae bacterium]
PEEEIPLAKLPAGITIADEAIPLGKLPTSGSRSADLLLLGALLTGLGAALTLKKRENGSRP